MSWDIKVWHEDAGDRTRLIIEAEPGIPDEVISAVVGNYWLDEVQFVPEDWDEAMMDQGLQDPSSHMHG